MKNNGIRLVSSLLLGLFFNVVFSSISAAQNTTFLYQSCNQQNFCEFAYRIEFTGMGLTIGGDTSFTYEVCGLATDPINPFVHVTFGLTTSCPIPFQLVSCDPVPADGCMINFDAATGIGGIKWRDFISTGECKTYTFTLGGAGFNASIPVGIKLSNCDGAATFCETSSITGPACLFTGNCGDGIIEPPEQCDDGNNDNGDGCSSNCLLEPACGDGTLGPGEQCDDGNLNNGDGCDSNCRLEPVCGNNILDPGEECDDGNTNDADGCQGNCQFPECGDSILDPGEVCDDGNTDSGDGCSSLCISESCGNGILDIGEECDDSNTFGGDGCSPKCTKEVCGNGILDPGENCDDGNDFDQDKCNNKCISVLCGDGKIDSGSGETCDDGNNQDGDGCSAQCIDENCGNGSLQPGEECDDGNQLTGDGCGASCRIEQCGNGIIDPGEVCDDGNTNNDDGCNENCSQGPTVTANPTPDGCTGSNVTEKQFAMDGGIKDQEQLVNRLLKLLNRYSIRQGIIGKPRRLIRKFINNMKLAANEVQLEGWRLAWSIPSVYFACTLTPQACIENTDNAKIKADYVTRVRKMHKLLAKTRRRLQKVRGFATRVDKKLSRRSRKKRDKNSKLADSIPDSVILCPNV